MTIAKKDIPNLLTFGRVLAVPLALGFMVAESGAWPLLVLFVVASLTDFFDGYLARKWNASSALGAMLDPVADKLLVALMLLFLAHRTDAALLPIAVILLREIYISGLREFLAQRQVALPVSKGGKWKTALQMAAVTLMLAGLSFGLHGWWQAGEAVLWLSAVLAFTSAVNYTRAALPQLRA